MNTLYFLVLIFLYWEQSETKCSSLLMCPSFCMKIKGGCYVCDCGMFSSYLRRAAEHLASISNKQPSQTGTQISSFNSGYNVNDDSRGVLNTQNGLSIQDFSKMMQLGFQSMKQQPYNIKPWVPQMSVPNFQDYGQSYKNMPGMNCAPVDDRCPSSCWTTDVFTGCVHCGCAPSVVNEYNHKLPPFSTLPTTIKSEIAQTTGQESQTSKTTADTFPAPTDKTVKQLSAVTRPNSSSSNVTSIIVPTKPPDDVKHLVVTTSLTQSPSSKTDGENTFKSILHYKSTAPHNLGLIVPTPMPTSSYKFLQMNTYAVPRPFTAFSNTILTANSSTYAVLKLLSTASYGYIRTHAPNQAEPTRIPNVTDLSTSPSQNTKPNAPGFAKTSTYSNNMRNHKTSQSRMKAKQQLRDNLATTSRMTGVQSDPGGNNIVEKTQYIPTTTSINKLGQQLNTSVTTTITPIRTMTENASSVPLHLSLNTTRSGNLFKSSPPRSTTSKSNNYGFFAHAING